MWFKVSLAALMVLAIAAVSVNRSWDEAVRQEYRVLQDRKNSDGVIFAPGTRSLYYLQGENNLGIAPVLRRTDDLGVLRAGLEFAMWGTAVATGLTGVASVCVWGLNRRRQNKQADTH